MCTEHRITRVQLGETDYAVRRPSSARLRRWKQHGLDLSRCRRRLRDHVRVEHEIHRRVHARRADPHDGVRRDRWHRLSDACAEDPAGQRRLSDLDRRRHARHRDPRLHPAQRDPDPDEAPVRARHHRRGRRPQEDLGVDARPFGSRPVKTNLYPHASARTARSLTRRLSQLFVDAWLSHRPNDRVLRRDLAADPPPHVTEAWIAAAFTPPDQRDATMWTTLAWSNAAIAELAAAELIVMGTPMYNYGMPSALKAWFDQVIGLGHTFSFDLRRGDWPIESTMAGKCLVVLSARGEFGFMPGGVREGRNQLDPHVATCAPLIGVAEGAIHTIAIEYQEFGDERHALSLAEAEAAANALAAELARSPALAA